MLRPQAWNCLPGDWVEVFGRSIPLAVEVGFGNGEFLVHAAAERPEWGFVGFDVTLTCVERAARRLEEAGTGNVRLVQLDARFGLRELFPDDGVREVYVNFPCPWPKARHAHRRLFESEFVHTLGAVLPLGGQVRLVTDVDWYAQQAREELEESGLFRAPAPRRLLDTGPATRYERKWRLEGREIWAVCGECTAPARPRRIAEGDMPHARVGGDVSWRRVTDLVGLKDAWPGGAYIVREAFLNPDGRSAILRVFSTDGDFQQQFFLMIARAGDGLLVKLDGATLPFRTPAVKRSVAAAAAALQEGGCDE